MLTFCATIGDVRAPVFLAPMADLMGRALRWQFREITIKQREVLDVRKDAQHKFGLTKRMALANEFDLTQVVAAWAGGLDYRMDQKADRIAALQEKVAGIERRLKTGYAGAPAPSSKSAKKGKAQPIVLAKRSRTKRKPLTPEQQKIRRTRDMSRVHYLKRQITALRQELILLEIERAGPPRICFGGRALLRKHQKFLSAQEAGGALAADAATSTSTSSPYVRDWRAKRATRFLLVGSKGETAGNQTAQYDAAEGTLQIRLPDAQGEAVRAQWGDTVIDRYGRVTLTGVRFDHGADRIAAALESNQALTWLLFGDDRGRWHAHVTLDPPAAPVRIGAALIAVRTQKWLGKKKETSLAVATREALHTSDERSASKPLPGFALSTDGSANLGCSASTPSTSENTAGCLGIDVNVDHLAVVHTDRYGNPLSRHTFIFPAQGTPSGVAQAMIGDVVKALTDLAERYRVGIAIEDLDFTKKKAALKVYGPAHARRLSAWSYAAFRQAIQARCARLGMACVLVNPAYTSVIGGIKYAPGYAMSRHHAAAMVIARRAQGWGERFVCMEGKALVGPGRNQSRHLPSRWRTVRTLARPAQKLDTSVGRTTEAGRANSPGPPRSVRGGFARTGSGVEN